MIDNLTEEWIVKNGKIDYEVAKKQFITLDKKEINFIAKTSLQNNSEYNIADLDIDINW
jgi:hypothetical protein